MIPMLTALAPFAAGAMNMIGGMQANEANEGNAKWASMFNQQQSETNRAWSAEQAQKQMDFQERMSNTQWQRGVQDMRSAGLNPMLAFSQGGASAPGGASGSSSAASAAQPHAAQNVLSGAVSSGMEAARAIQEYNIKRPLENISDTANKSIEAAKDLVKPVSEKVSEVVQAIEDKVKDGSLTSAVADRVERVVEGAKSFAGKVGEQVRMPGKMLSQGVSSAGEAVSRAKRAAGEAIHGKRGVEPPPSKGKVPRSAQQNFKRYEWKFNVPAN